MNNNKNIDSNTKINLQYSYDCNRGNIRKVTVTYKGEKDINEIIQKMIEYRIKNNWKRNLIVEICDK